MSDWRNSRDYRIWRVKVIRRDKRCRICGEIRDRQAHHINHATYFPQLRFEVENGVTLCKRCHIQFHSNYKRSSRQKCDLSDWKNFIELSKYMIDIGRQYGKA